MIIGFITASSINDAISATGLQGGHNVFSFRIPIHGILRNDISLNIDLGQLSLPRA